MHQKTEAGGAGVPRQGLPQIDWPALMRAGLRGLGLTPACFWALTPAELCLMLGLSEPARGMSRGRLDALMALYPDAAAGQTTEEAQND